MFSYSLFFLIDKILMKNRNKRKTAKMEKSLLECTQCHPLTLSRLRGVTLCNYNVTKCTQKSDIISHNVTFLGIDTQKVMTLCTLCTLFPPPIVTLLQKLNMYTKI